jgi:CrcB protein
MDFELVGIGGALGSMTRYGVGLVVHSTTFPYATLLVNVIGYLCIGLALPSLEKAAALSPEMRLLLIVGFLGGFTTFSAFGSESIALVRSGLSVALLSRRQRAARPRRGRRRPCSRGGVFAAG